jgi:glycosyltransferase involved in cell wall biosynthesis
MITQVLKQKKFYQNLKKYKKIKIINLKKNMGAGYCRNLAIKKSKSQILCFY